MKVEISPEQPENVDRNMQIGSGRSMARDVDLEKYNTDDQVGGILYLKCWSRKRGKRYQKTK